MSSIRHGLLALLSEAPVHGYGLKSAFERSTAGTWSLNIGQVYSTLGRLERDGLVEPEATEAAQADEESTRQTWRITPAGRTALTEWLNDPVVDDPPPRDELTIKVLLATAVEQVDVAPILQSQRAATMARLQQLTRHKRRTDPDGELPWTLLLDALILRAEAEVRWLDLCEARIADRAKRSATGKENA